MPVIKSAMKRVRTNEKVAARNRSQLSAMRTSIKAFEIAAKNNAENANELLNTAYSRIDRAKTKGLIKANNAGRKKSRLAKMLAK